MPFIVTASFDTAGRTMMGVAPAALGALVEGFDPKPLAYGANCGVGASDLLVAILAMSAADADAPLIAKANAGVPQWHGAEIHYSGTPELMEAYAGLAADCGARIIGGCCGNTPGPCGGDAARARRPRSRPSPEPRSDRRRARPARRAGRRGTRRSEPPPRARMNAKAKRRAGSQANRTGEVGEPETIPPPAFDGAAGAQVFDVDAAGAGERLDRFLGQAAAERRVALSRTRLKALIEAGEIRVDGARGARSVDAARRRRNDRLRGAAGGGIAAPRRGHAA